MLGLFGARDLRRFRDDWGFDDPALEVIHPDGESGYLKQLLNRLPECEPLPPEKLRTFDRRIVEHTRRIQSKRSEPIRWKYFQYLALLFTEIYLDRLFGDPAGLLAVLNAEVERFNAEPSTPERDRVGPYVSDDLHTLALWCATGAGKTLLMHVNLLQYWRAVEAAGRLRELRGTVLLTPNEGLTRQHLDELRLSDIPAVEFEKDGDRPMLKDLVEVIDIHKLASGEGEERKSIGEKRVAVESFEGRNLVLIDEGHRGTSGVEWLKLREKLCEGGFSFEYSATFGQAVNKSSDRELKDAYAKCVLIDYSYKHFYGDGFGKDYRIHNLQDDRDDETRRVWLVAALLAYYQQLRVFDGRSGELHRFRIERPLWIFVGRTVKSVSKGEVSDIVDVLAFFADFVRPDGRSSAEAAMTRLFSATPGLHDEQGREVLSGAFDELRRLKVDDAETLYDDVLRRVFNAPGGGKLHISRLAEAEGEIAVRVGTATEFAVVNVGDAKAVEDECRKDAARFAIEPRDVGDSLFAKVNKPDSTVNVVIGAKKFTEGWNSWRVSSMGLMNVGQSEGAQIIQLFGRGVRLKGRDGSLRRSARLKPPPDSVPAGLRTLETLAVFGLRADYMRKFREYLEEEGVPPDGVQRTEIVIPTTKLEAAKTKLTYLKLPDRKKFRDSGERPTLAYDPRAKVVVDLYPRVQSMVSEGATRIVDVLDKKAAVLTARHLAFIDFDRLYFDVLRTKAERSMFNLRIDRAALPALLGRPDWYTLLAPPEALAFDDVAKFEVWQDAARTLLIKYVERFYAQCEAAWAETKAVYTDFVIGEPHTAYPDEYVVSVESSETALVQRLEEMRDVIVKGGVPRWAPDDRGIGMVWFDRHMYAPLLSKEKGSTIEIRPVPLNAGERKFVEDLKGLDFSAGPLNRFSLFLFRNESRGRGLAFFSAENFHPDFVVWLVDGARQFVTFVDPKGLHHSEERLDDPKIQLHRAIKRIEDRLRPSAPNVVLNSFIVSTTAHKDVGWGSRMPSRDEFQSAHVVFQDDPDYLTRLFSQLLGRGYFPKE